MPKPTVGSALRTRFSSTSCPRVEALPGHGPQHHTHFRARRCRGSTTKAASATRSSVVHCSKVLPAPRGSRGQDCAAATFASRLAAEFGCVGSLAGIYTASMPVLVVKNGERGNLAYCNFYEGTNPRRLNYGVYDEGVRERLLHVQDVVAPVIREAVAWLRAGLRSSRSCNARCTWATNCTAATPQPRCCSHASCFRALLRSRERAESAWKRPSRRSRPITTSSCGCPWRPRSARPTPPTASSIPASSARWVSIVVNLQFA